MIVTIVDYGMGNLGSITNMFKKIGVKTVVARHPEQIRNANKILLPGVGAFDSAVRKIKENKLDEALNEKVAEGVPLLGICLGMQLLTRGSEEGCEKGFGWIDAETLSFRKHVSSGVKVPHMGWNVVKKNSDSILLNDFETFDDLRFYFVHSYFVRCQHVENTVLRTMYCVDFDSMIQKDNVWGVQFHPEKSHKFGLKLFENFSRI